MCWLLQLLSGWREAEPNISLAIDLGANFGPLVSAGELHRLVTANWLHGFWLHLVFNALGLLVLGRGIEPLLGGRSVFVIFVASCLGGTALSAATSWEMPSMGASTGVAGLFGALGVVLFGLRHVLPPRTARLRRSWIFVLGLQVGLEILLETPIGAFAGVRIDHAAHLGGFVLGGLSCAWVLGLAAGSGGRVSLAPSGRRLWTPTLLLLAVMCVGFGVVVGKWINKDQSSLLTLVTAAREQRFSPPPRTFMPGRLLPSRRQTALCCLRRRRFPRYLSNGFEPKSTSAEAQQHGRPGGRSTLRLQTRAQRCCSVSGISAMQSSWSGRQGRPLSSCRSVCSSPWTPNSHGSCGVLSEGGTPHRPEPDASDDSNLEPTGHLVRARTVGSLEVLAFSETSDGSAGGLLRVLIPEGKKSPRRLTLSKVDLPEQVTVALVSNRVASTKAQRVEWIPMDPDVAGYP